MTSLVNDGMGGSAWRTDGVSTRASAVPARAGRRRITRTSQRRAGDGWREPAGAAGERGRFFYQVSIVGRAGGRKQILIMSTHRAGLERKALASGGRGGDTH